MHFGGKFFKQVKTILWAWAGFWVILHREDRAVCHTNTTVGSVKQGHMGLKHSHRQRLAVYSETMVHGGYFNLVAFHIFHRVVGAMVTMIHFDGFSTKRQG